ncbi:hypothetical protein DF185_02185 [Marinifilum breve]|uniref:histidine kinase n=1 Tax=Marinifilum breve TaxID=2184082 RepID=A0A2V4AFQ5_9BACT|nr:hybrid sensor histidine kinase/response regulator [Marinifilum breve]PXY02924.1 hypothetical protein DF185_02185 [Marinifilum breve]
MNTLNVIKLLVVDDKPENLNLISSFFEDSNYFVRTSGSYEETYELCNEIEFDLLLIDIRMPRDGFAFAEKIRVSDLNSNTPVIFMAEKTDQENISKAFKVGCRDVITKPFQLEELLSKVSTHSLLQIQHKQIHELMLAKDKIFSIIGHDLRSPFNSLIGFSKLLLENLEASEDKSSQKYAELICNISTKNLELLDNLLVYARDLEKQAESTLEKIDVHKLISEVLQIVQPTAALKKIQLVQIFGEAKSTFGTKDLIATMIRNILSNAIKFSRQQGFVTVQTRVIGNMIEIDITDTGVGMDANQLNNLFDKEHPQSSLGTSGEMGSGYGLLLSKEIADKHNGEIKVESHVGNGTSFKIRLPIYEESK